MSKEICTYCGGIGEVKVLSSLTPNESGYSLRPCPRCYGHGRTGVGSHVNDKRARALLKQLLAPIFEFKGDK
jgi:DnaJ-class molecular chaperone